MVHLDAFGAFSTDALVHFGSGIQVQVTGGGYCDNNTSQPNWRLWLANWAELGNKLGLSLAKLSNLISNLGFVWFLLSKTG